MRRTCPAPRPTISMLLGLVPLLLSLLLPAAAAAQDGAAVAAPVALQQELVDKFAPVSYLKQGEGPCDENGEPFLPAPVDVLFNDPTVSLRDNGGKETVKQGVTGADLFQRGEAYFLDLLGHPRTPGCDYAQRFHEVMGDHKPVVYAHIAKEAGKPGLAVQYWFFYYFNDFNNKHESDWEMIQLRFDAETVEEALKQEPVQVAFAQHEGGEIADWNDPKLEKEGLRPVTYPSRGSHASYYGPAIWIGWGEQQSGFGCDDTTGPSFRVDPEVRLITGNVAGPDDPMAWTTFTGRWGARESWVFDGPTGPNAKPRWTAPMTWMEGLRRDSLAINAAEIIGPAPTQIFCDLAADGSELFALSAPYPWLVFAVLAVLATVAVVMLKVAWPYLTAASRLYHGHARVFAMIGMLVVPITVLLSGFHFLLEHNPDFAALTNLSEDSDIVKGIVSLGTTAQRLLLTAVISPLVIVALSRILDGEPTSIRDAFERLRPRFWTTALAMLRAFLITLVLTLSIVGIPWAIHRTVAWHFVPQEALLDGRRGHGALSASRGVVRGRWWKTAMVTAVLAFVAAAVGPIVGLVLLIGLKVPLEFSNIASAAVYAVTQPLAVIGSTLLWRDLRASREVVKSESRDVETDAGSGATLGQPA